MKLLMDFFPVVLFFAVYKYTGDIVIATAVLIPVTIAQVGWTWLRHRRVENMHLVTLVLVVLLGGATILFQDATFIQWKPTIVNWLFALAFLGSEYIGERNLVQRMLEANLQLERPVWTRLNFAWITFFTFVGALNLVVAFNFDENTWVNFKLFGLLGLTLLFVVVQGLWLARHLPDDEPTDREEHTPPNGNAPTPTPPGETR